MKRLAVAVALVASACTPAQIAAWAAAHPRPGGFLACVRQHESGGDYRAENPTSSASGAYQFLDSTWRTVSASAGHPSGHAAYAAPWVQDAVAVWTVNHVGRSPWAGTGC